jgi:hypothetical protein
MNDQHPYDQLIRDKLNRLPVPDVQKTWPDMRILLDDEMPEGGRSRRRGGWWFFSAVLIFIIVGSWTLLTLNFSKQNVDPPLTATNTTSPPATGTVAEKANTGTLKDSEKSGVEDDKILLTKEEGSDNNEVSSENKEEGPKNKEGPENKEAPENKEGPANKKERPENKEAIRDNNETTIQPLTVRTVKDGKQAKSIPGNIDPALVAVATGNKSTNGVKGNRKNNSGPASSDKLPGAIGPLTKDSFESKKSPLVSTAIVGVYDDTQDDLIDATTIKNIERSPSTSYAQRIDSINKNYGSYITYAPVSRKYYRKNKKYGRPANVRPPYTTEGRNFALGLSLPLVFPLGDQQALSYNVNAGPNTATDYIPAPHAQYHFNDKVYLQSELQVLSPQYIKPALLYQSKTSNNFYKTTSSVSAQKLYYFNVPLSLHYSPFKNFFMGTGLQFSSLLSGVALTEEQRTGMVSSDSMYTATYSKFRNDSISDKLSGSEMRLMLDANYYWNKFTVGLRYNQALSNYVSTRAAPSVPITVDKNKSLQFYLRYNLWEDKKRKTPNKQTLVVK